MLVGRLTLQFHSLANRKSRIITCVVVAFYPVNPLNFLLHFYAIGVWIRSENRWGSFCPVFYKSQCFQASAAFITEAEILMKPARIRRYLISSIKPSFFECSHDVNLYITSIAYSLCGCKKILWFTGESFFKSVVDKITISRPCSRKQKKIMLLQDELLL